MITYYILNEPAFVLVGWVPDIGTCASFTVVERVYSVRPSGPNPSIKYRKGTHQLFHSSIVPVEMHL